MRKESRSGMSRESVCGCCPHARFSMEDRTRLSAAETPETGVPTETRRRSRPKRDRMQGEPKIFKTVGEKQNASSSAFSAMLTQEWSLFKSYLLLLAIKGPKMSF